MKKTFKLLALLPLFCGLLLTTSCDKEDDKNSDNPFVGTWKWAEDEANYKLATFNTNMSFIVISYWEEEAPYTMSGTYSYQENTKTITINYDEGGSEEFSYVFSGNKLTLTDDEGDDIVYVKQ
jgi:hypothetical protein